MPIDERPTGHRGGTTIVTTECPLCGDPLKDHESLSQHLRYNCSAND